MIHEKVYAAGGVLWREFAGQTQVMLILRHGVWDIPKGGQERGEKIEDTAVREVMEELGTERPVLGDFLAETQHSYLFEGIRYHKHTFWYAMQTTSTDFTPQALEEITECRWVELTEALGMVAYDNLKAPLHALQRRLGLG